MKKAATAFLLFDLIAGLLFLGLQEMRRYQILEALGKTAEEMGDVRKIAITFDDECIIRLSQENCSKEAVSMI